MADSRRRRWEELSGLLDRADRRGLASLSPEEVRRLCRLYRHVTIDLSRERSAAGDPGLVRYLNALAARAHGQVYRNPPRGLRPALDFVLTGFPRLARRRALPILVAAGLFLGTTVASWVAVVRDPELAYSLFDENMVEFENLRLEKQEGEYRGNFTFSAAESPFVAVIIIANNVGVAARAFALGALGCLPGVLLLVYNGRMLGTLTGVVGRHGFLLPFYSLVLTHGVLELSAICIASCGGLLLGWAMIAPGRYTRADALRRAAPDALGLLGGAALLLVVAGLIEGHITPHFPAAVRWSVACLSGMGLTLYLGWAGRSKDAAGGDFQVAVDDRRSQA